MLWKKVKLHPVEAEETEDDFYDVAHYKLVNAELKTENEELKAQIKQKDMFVQELLLRIIDQAKPFERKPSAAELYLAKKDGQGSTSQSVKEHGKSRLPG